MLLLLGCASSDPALSARLGDDTAWACTFGGSATDEAWGVAALDDDVIFGAYASVPGKFPDAWLMRLDSGCEAAWTTSWGEDGTDKLFPVVVDGDTVYAGGTSYTTLDNATADGFVLALDASTGTLDWDWSFATEGYEEVDDIVPYDGQLYLGGWSTSTTNDAMLAALDPDGTEAWTSAWDSGGWDEANGRMYVDADSIYITGLRGGSGYGVGGTGFVAAFDHEGELRWMEDLPGCDGYCDGLGLASEGTLLYTVGDALVGLDSELDVHAFTLDGDEVWSQREAGASSAFARAVAVHGDTVYVAANIDDDVAIRTYDSATGEPGATATWAGAGKDRAHEIAVTDDAIYVAGDTESIGLGGTDGLLLRFPLDLASSPPTE